MFNVINLGDMLQELEGVGFLSSRAQKVQNCAPHASRGDLARTSPAGTQGLLT